MNSNCSFAKVPAHSALFEIIFYGVTDTKKGAERHEVYKTKYACVEHLETVCEDDFRESKSVGDQIRNLRTEETYWRISDALKNIDQFPAEITIFYKSPEILPLLKKNLEDCLGTPGEMKDNALYAQGGKNSVMLLARRILDEIEGAGLNIQIKPK